MFKISRFGSDRVKRFSNITGRVGLRQEFLEYGVLGWVGSGRVGSGQAVSKISRVGSGQVKTIFADRDGSADPTRSNPIRSDPTRPDPTRPEAVFRFRTSPTFLRSVILRCRAAPFAFCPDSRTQQCHSRKIDEQWECGTLCEKKITKARTGGGDGMTPVTTACPGDR